MFCCCCCFCSVNLIMDINTISSELDGHTLSTLHQRSTGQETAKVADASSVCEPFKCSKH